MVTAWMLISRYLALFTCAYAFLRGDIYQKQVAVVLAVGWIVSFIFARIIQDPSFYIFVIDLVALVIFGWVSIRSRRLWSLFMAAFQLNAVVAHVVKLMSTQINWYSYVTSIGFWGGYAITLALLGGLVAQDLKRWRTRLNKDSFSKS
jgi:hypothetical protein